jgi:hypothetical protein
VATGSDAISDESGRDGLKAVRYRRLKDMGVETWASLEIRAACHHK